ncbi:MAG: hypothetical protein ACKVXR_09955 [Planctomycetota bacterium]
MNPRSRALSLPFFFLGSALGAGLFFASCSDAQAGSGSTARPDSPVESYIADAPLAGYQKELLDLAFDTASSFPRVPHLKNRSRAQEVVVQACFELDQPRRALGYVQRIDNWLRGAGYADYALYCARKGDTTSVQRHLDLAREVYEKTEKEEIQDWQRDRIRVTIAKTLRRLGRSEEAVKFETDLVEVESIKVEAAKAALAGGEAFDEQLQAVDAAAAVGNFDHLRSALETCVRLFDRFYEDPERRSQAEAKVKASWSKLPITVRVDLVMDLAESALGHEDRGKALELVQEAEAIMDAATWKPELRIPVMARLAVLRHGAGDGEGARKGAEAALASFEAERDQIFDYERAETLQPLAEAFRSLGDTAAAHGIYAKAVEESALNPNRRPRADDLTAICCSMALHAVEPDAELRARMLEIRSGLEGRWVGEPEKQ